MFNTPILLLIFNRPDTTKKVFERIREIKPKELFVAADGPREGNERDKINCKAVRAIATNVDWECEVHTLLREGNLGCRFAVSQAITWFFDHVEEGVILEDDTLPNLSFFFFCEEMLNYYRSNRQIMVISGNNFQEGKKRGIGSYYFSRYTHIWGWATWRHAWSHYKTDCEGLDEFIISNQFKKVTNSQSERNYWVNVFQKVVNGEISSWDYIWHYHIWKNDGMVILPNFNLVSNIGFGMEATHTKELSNRWSNMATKNINKIVHPKSIRIDRRADEFTFEHNYIGRSRIATVKKKLFTLYDLLNMRLIKNKVFKKLTSLVLRRNIDESTMTVNQEKVIQDLQLTVSFILNEKLDDNIFRPSLINELKGTTPVEAFYIICALQQVQNIDGDICELGIAQGDTSALIANEVRNVNKRIWLFDSFEGLPKPSREDKLINDIFDLGDITKYEGTMAFPQSLVKEKIKKLKLDENKIKIVSGFVKEGYKWPEDLKKISFAYIDFDFYEPIKEALEFLKKRLSQGGIVIVDDYDFFSSGAKIAVDEFLENNKEDFTFELPFRNLSHFIKIVKN